MIATLSWGAAAHAQVVNVKVVQLLNAAHQSASQRRNRAAVWIQGVVVLNECQSRAEDWREPRGVHVDDLSLGGGAHGFVPVGVMLESHAPSIGRLTEPLAGHLQSLQRRRCTPGVPSHLQSHPLPGQVAA